MPSQLRRRHVQAGNGGAVRIQGIDPANDIIIRAFGDLVTLLEVRGPSPSRGAYLLSSSGTTNMSGRAVHCPWIQLGPFMPEKVY